MSDAVSAYTTVKFCFYYIRLQEKHVKEKQCQHQRNIIELQDKLKKNQIAVSFENFNFPN